MKSSLSAIVKSSAIAILFVSYLTGGQTLAQTFVWSGLSTADDNWSTGENWGGGVAPSDNSLVLFNDPTAQSSSNQDTASIFSSIGYDTSQGDFSLTGQFTSFDELVVSGGGALDTNLFLAFGDNSNDVAIEIQDGSMLRLANGLDNADSSFVGRRPINGDGQFLLGNGAMIFNAIEVASGVTTTFDNCSSADIQVVANSVFNGSTIFRDANVDFFANGSTFNSTVNFESGNVNLSGFTVDIVGLTTVESDAIVSIVGDVTGAGDVVVQGELQLEFGSSVAKNVSIEDGGRLFGEGEFKGTLEIFGLLDPGTSAGTLSVDGDVDLFDTTVTCIELGGTMDGESDLISSIGDGDTISLDGVLEVSFLDGFMPSEDDEFSFIQGFDIDGQFSNTGIGDAGFAFVAPGNDNFGTLVTSAGTFEIEYGSDFVRLFGFQAVPEPGSGALMIIGLFGIVLRRQRRN